METMRFCRQPEKIISLLDNAYKDIFASVKVCGGLNDQFKTIVGILQGCVISPLLFNIVLELITATALMDE